MELYIKGRKADLAPDQVFAVTVQSNDITRPDTVQSSYSNSLTLPFTQRNQAMLENANEVGSQSDMPYRKLEATVLQDGVEVVPLPRAYLSQAGDGYEVDIFSGAVDLFERLGDKSIQDLDLSRFNHVWNFDTIWDGARSFRDYTFGYIYDAINNGKPFSLVDPWGNNMLTLWAEDMHPSVFVRTVFEQMLSEAGVKYNGIEDELWDRLLLPFSNEKPVHNQAWIDAHQLATPLPGGFAGMPMNYGKAKLTLKVQVERVTDMYESRIGIIVINGPDGLDPIVKAEYFPITAIGEVEFTTTIEINSSEDISAWRWSLFYNNVVPEYTDDPGRSWFSSGTYTVAYEEDTYFKTEWDLALNLPDIKQKDFFKAIRSLFDLMVRFDPYSNALTFTPFNKLLENKANALDWSSKLVYVDFKPVPVQYRFGEFAQKSWWRYKEDELGGDGDSFMTVEDEQLAYEEDIVELPFAASAEQEGFLYLPLFTPRPESERKYDKNTATLTTRGQTFYENGDRVLVLDASADPVVKEGWAIYELDASVSTANKFVLREHKANFHEREKIEPRLSVLNTAGLPLLIRDTKDYAVQVTGIGSSFSPISFASLLPTRYMALQQVLTKCKGITPYFRLNVQDVANYDPAVPIWLDQYQQYFYLNSINEFTGEGPTECQLWRL